MKNFLLAGCALVLGALPSVALSQEYRDAPADYVLEQQIMYPQYDGTFNGAGMVTRLEFTLAAVDHLFPDEDFAGCFDTIAPSQPARYTLLFSDVDRTEWYAPRLCIAMRTGLIQGYPNGSFRPFASITAAEAAKIMARGYGIAAPENPSIPWYAQPMRALAVRGAMGERSVPETSLTRSGMARMYYALRDEQFATTPALETAPPMETVTPPSSAPAMPTSSGPEFLPFPDVAAPAPSEDDCPVARVNSPGTALLVLGLEAHPRTLVRHSPRELEALAKAGYESGSFSGPDNGKPASDLLSRCSSAFARNPSGGLQEGTEVTKVLTGGRIPHRFVRAEAEQRGLGEDPRINRNVGY